MDRGKLELFTCSVYVCIVVRHRRVIVNMGRLIRNPGTEARAVSRPPEVLALSQVGICFKILEVQNLFFVLWTYVP